MLVCEGLSCKRGEKLLFSGLGFALGGGAVMTMVGSNGYGKTSLLRIIAGLLRPSAGGVLWEGKHIEADYGRYTSALSFLGHRDAIKQELTVLENLMFWASITGSGVLVTTAVSYLDLGDVVDTPCYMLSAGWQKRVALARLMLNANAKLWLLDEPFANLDDHGVKALSQLMAARADNGGIIILTSPTEPPIDFGSVLDLRDFRAGGAA